MAEAEEQEKKRFDKVKLTKEQSMLQGVSFHASDTVVTAAGPRVVIFGGQRSGLSDECWVYEPTGDGWTQCYRETEQSPWPGPRTQATLCAIGAEPQTRALLFAGYVMNIGAQSDVWAIDMTVDIGEVSAAWTPCTCSGTPPTERYGHSATTLGAMMVVFGGQADKIQYNDVHVLATGNYEWSQPAVSGVPPSVRTAHLALALPKQKGKILIHGGFNRIDRCYSDAFLLVCDGASAAWEPLAFDVSEKDKTPARAQHAGAMVAGGKYGYIFGGYDGAKNLQDLLLFSIDTKVGPVIRDVAAGPAPEPRCRHSCHAVGDSLVVLGGYDGTKPWTGDVWTADISDAAATLAKLSTAPSSPQRRQSSLNRRTSSGNMEEGKTEEEETGGE